MAINKKEYEGKSFIDNNGETFVVDKIYGWDAVKVSWPKTKTSIMTYMSSVKSGAVKNPIHGKKRPSKTMDWIGRKSINNQSQIYEVIAEDDKLIKIKFDITKNEIWIEKDRFGARSIGDNTYPTVYGVGYKGDFDKDAKELERSYNLWTSIIARCYDPNQREIYKSYVGVIMSEEWKCFAVFLDDIKTLIGFEEWLDDRDMELDKDMLSKEHKIYSKETCMFIPRSMNRSFRVK